MGVSAKDATRTVQTFKTSTDGGQLVVHHNVDTVIAGTGATSLGKAEDAAHASGDTGVAILAVRRDAPAPGSGTDGDYSTVNVGANGGVWTTDIPATQGGYSTYSNADLGSAGISVKGSAGQVYGWYLYNRSAAERVVKFYDKATAATVGTDTPKLRIPLPAGGGSNVEFGKGIPFTLGISVGAVTEITDAGTTNPSTNDVVVNILYK